MDELIWTRLSWSWLVLFLLGDGAYVDALWDIVEVKLGCSGTFLAGLGREVWVRLKPESSLDYG